VRLVAAEAERETVAGGTDERPRLAEPLVSFLAPASLEADQYRTLRQLVERLRRDSNCQVFAVTSAAAGEGKTVTALNLAGALAQASNTRVLVIDADLHRPAVARYLGLTDRRAPALAEAILHDEYGLAQTVRRLESLNLSVLLAGNAHLGPYELLASPRLEKLLRDARSFYDYVLIDTPPVVPLADCRLLGRLVDGFIVVVAANKTPRKLLAEALNLLDPAKVIGLVFNGDDRPLAAYYGYYGYSQPSSHHTSWWRRALSRIWSA
jgi:capsular exopolysaccharide synthesis family protein